MIDNAEVERSDGRSWLADGHGVVLERPPLTPNPPMDGVWEAC